MARNGNPERQQAAPTPARSYRIALTGTALTAVFLRLRLHLRSVINKSYTNYCAAVKGEGIYSRRSNSWLSVHEDGTFAMKVGDKNTRKNAKEFKEHCLTE